MSFPNDGDETNLDKLLKLIDKRKYTKKRKLSDSLEDDKTSVSDSDLLEDPEDEEDLLLKFKENLINKDLYSSFNEDYESFVKSNEEDESEFVFNHPFFSKYNFKGGRPLVKYLLKLEKVPDLFSNLSKYFISNTISKRIQSMCKESKKGSKIPSLQSNVQYLFACLNSYVDVFYINNNVSVFDSVRFAYSLHIANHIVKSSLKKKESKEDERFEGFTRPKVLVICGLRCTAREVINNLLTLIPSSKSNQNLDRFESEFNLNDEDLNDQIEMFTKTKKPLDFVKTFSGNQDDAFKIGLRYESGLLHLYSPFYSSDIVVASPLGLRPLIASKEPDYDFLSSIEILVVDRLDIIKFQNWRLFMDLFKVINLTLVKWRDADINKIRMSAIDGQLQEYRQNIFISSSRNNKRGSIRLIVPPKTDYVSLVSKFKVQQMFIKVPCSNVKNSQEDCLNYFVENMLANLEEINGVLIVLSDYTQYFRISKKLKSSNLDYLTCHESNTAKQMTFARQQFHSNSVPILVTTFRLLFFKRYLFKGSSKIFLIEPPEYSHLYKDFVRMVEKSRSNTIVCYYTKYQGMILEPIVGSHRISKLVDAPDTKITQFH